MTGQRRRYYDDTYLFCVDTPVLSVAGDLITVAECIFHPRGGGQPDDLASIDGHPVTELLNTESGVAARCPDLAEPAPQAVVRTEIDPATRLRHAALHTAGHLIDAIGRGLGWQHARHSHVPEQARVEFTVPDGQLPDDLAEFFLQAARAAVAADHRVWSDWQGETRYVHIDSFGADPCGGTHVASLGDLANLTVRSVKRKGATVKVGYEAEHRAR